MDISINEHHGVYKLFNPKIDYSSPKLQAFLPSYKMKTTKKKKQQQTNRLSNCAKFLSYLPIAKANN